MLFRIEKILNLATRLSYNKNSIVFENAKKIKESYIAHGMITDAQVSAKEGYS